MPFSLTTEIKEWRAIKERAIDPSSTPGESPKCDRHSQHQGIGLIQCKQERVSTFFQVRYNYLLWRHFPILMLRPGQCHGSDRHSSWGIFWFQPPRRIDGRISRCWISCFQTCLSLSRFKVNYCSSYGIRPFSKYHFFHLNLFPLDNFMYHNSSL